MENVSIEFGDYLTVISGLNGTGKSSILGLVGHLFSFREKGSEVKYKHKTLDNKPYEAEYSEIFKFCPTHEFDKNYEYEAELDDGGEVLNKQAKSRYVKSEKRFRIDVGIRAKEGEGKIDYPVIYLGLRRLFPLAQEKEGDILIEESGLGTQDIHFYKNESSEIFVSLEKNVSPQHAKTPNKDFFATETDSYGTLGNSAGQDNLGQILTAIMSFKKLEPNRGILLIDELDTTMFAGSQINLIKRLYKYARTYSLQIVFTTHSLEIINFLLNKNYEGVKVNFLEIRNRKVVNKLNPEFHYIKSRIMIETKEKHSVEKINLLCEDPVGALWCRSLLNATSLKSIIDVYGATLSNGALADLASKRLSCLKRFIFVLDGDSRANARFARLKNVVFLPEDKCPESIFYTFLATLPEDDSFWGGEMAFYKDTCFNGFVNVTESGGHKRWFQDKKDNFGSGCSKLLNRWKRGNAQEAQLFIDDLSQAISNSS